MCISLLYFIIYYISNLNLCLFSPYFSLNCIFYYFVILGNDYDHGGVHVALFISSDHTFIFSRTRGLGLVNPDELGRIRIFGLGPSYFK